MDFEYSSSSGTKNPLDIIVGKAANLSEVESFLDKLIQPKRSVSILPREPNGLLHSIDFHCSEPGRIEMEIMPYQNDENFATIDVPAAKRIVDLLIATSNCHEFRTMLHKLQIKWTC